MPTCPLLPVINNLSDTTDTRCTLPDWQPINIVSATPGSGLNQCNGEARPLPPSSPIRQLFPFLPTPLPFEIVSPVEDLLQQGDHGKGADEYEEQSSVSQQIPAWRRVSVSHPSEKPLKLRWVEFSSLSPSHPFCWEAKGNVCWLFSEQSKDKISHCSALLPLPCPFWMWAPGLHTMATVKFPRYSDAENI